MRLIPLDCVRDGCFLGKTVYDNLGKPLFKKGVRLTPHLLKKIKDLNISSVFISDDYSEKEIEDVIKPELRKKSIKLVKEAFDNVERIYFSSSNSINAENKKDYFLSIQNLAEELIDNILSNKNILVTLVDIKSMDNYTYQHSVNVAIISLVLGLGLNLPKGDLINLCVGALLHDLGKIFIPKEILLKNGPLNKSEFNIMKEHPQKGYNYIKNIKCIHNDAKQIILQHHERVDTLGYPKGLKSHEISTLSKITSVSDVYDALISDRPYRKGLCPNDAFEFILSGAGSIFDFEIVKAFSQIIVPYPKGTIVKLSNGDVGIVKDTPPHFPLRPNLKIIKSENISSIGLNITLINELSLVISSIEYNFPKLS